MTEDRIVLNPEEVWKRRVLSRMHQAQLAERAGVHQTHISLIERGKRGGARGVPVEMAQSLADALGCTVDDLKQAA